jgi:hypothetical protein
LSPLFIFLLVVPLIILAGIASHRAEQRRKKERMDWAAAHGFTWQEGRDTGFGLEYPNFKILHQGQDRYAYNVMTGAWKGHPATVFDYHYKTESRDSKGRRHVHHHYFSCAILKSGFPLKHLEIRAEGFFDRIGEFMGFDDIDFESDEFSRKFHVKAADRKWAYDILHPRAMDLLLSSPTFTLAMDSKSVLAHRAGKLDLPVSEQALALLANLLDMIPEYVKQDAQASGSAPT